MGNKAAKSSSHDALRDAAAEPAEPSVFDDVPRDIVLVILSFLPDSPFARDYSLRGRARREQRITLMSVCKAWRNALDEHTTEIILPTATDDLAQVTPRWVAQLQRHTHVTTLSLARWPLLQERNLPDIVAAFPALTSLDLSGCEIASPYFHLDSMLARPAPRLRSLSLRRTKVMDGPLCNLLTECKQLRHLDLSDCSFVGEAAMGAIGRLHHLESLDLNFSPGLRCHDIFQSRCLVCGQLRVEDTCCGLQKSRDLIQEEALNQALSGLSSLQRLNLRGRLYVSDTTLVTLSQGCPLLRSLDLDGCTHIAGAALLQLVAGLPFLKQLHINFCVRVDESEWQQVCSQMMTRGVEALHARIQAEFDPELLCVGDMCDVIDTVNKPYKSSVLMRVDATKHHGTKLYFRYEGWGKEWDEWFDLSKPERRQKLLPIAPLLYRRN